MKNRKTVTISLPCWNEEENIKAIVQKIDSIFKNHLPEYQYIIQFSDNCSTDNTRQILRQICQENTHVRAIFNVSNVSGSAIHSILQADGDCCIHMASDFQDPPELIPELIQKWENGAKVVCAIKTSSEENAGMWRIRTLYYKIMCKFSTIPQIKHFTGFGLYDRSFIEILRRLGDPIPTLRGIVAEYGYNVENVYYKQPVRKSGKSSKSFMKNYDYAMKSFTTYSRIIFHIATLLGMGLGIVCLLGLAIIVITKLILGAYFQISHLLLAVSIFFVGAVQIFFIGFLGEYITNINQRIIKRPLAIEAERIGNWQGSQVKEEWSNPYVGFEPTENRTLQ